MMKTDCYLNLELILGVILFKETFTEVHLDHSLSQSNH